jgi:hypothetical protein
MSRWSVCRSTAHASALGATFVGVALTVWAVVLAGPASAGTVGPSLKVTPDRGLVTGREVTVSGHGLTHSAAANGLTWFVMQCNDYVHKRLNPATDTPHCDVTGAKAVRVSRNGTFSTKFRVRTGIVGDGYCGTIDHASCVLAVTTAKGQGGVVKITFATPATTTTTTTTSTTSH